MKATLFLTCALLLASSAFAAGCSGEPRTFEKNMEAMKVTGGVDEKNLEQVRRMEKGSDELDRLREVSEKPFENAPEDFPPTR